MAGGMAEAIDNLPSKSKVLSSNPGSTKKKILTICYKVLEKEKNCGSKNN
jgi:hypothetical protein